MIRDPWAASRTGLVRIDELLLRVPQLAIHLAEEPGNAQPGSATSHQRRLGRQRPAAVAAAFVAERFGIAPADLLSGPDDP